MTAGVPFRLVDRRALPPTGPSRSKLTGGGDIYPRFDIDARIALRQRCRCRRAGRVRAMPRSSSARRPRSPRQALPIPIAIQTTFKTAGRTVELDPVVARGRGGRRQPAHDRHRHASGLDEPARRPQARRAAPRHRQLRPVGAAGRTSAPAGTWTLPPVALPIDLDLSLNSIGFAQEELTNFVAPRRALRAGRAEIERLAFDAPGETRDRRAGELGPDDRGRRRAAASPSRRGLRPPRALPRQARVALLPERARRPAPRGGGRRRPTPRRSRPSATSASSSARRP